MNRSRAVLKSAVAGVAMFALASLASTAHAQAPATVDPAGGASPAPAAPAAPASSAAPASPASPAAPASPATAPGAAAPADVTLDSPPEPSHRTAWPWIIIGTGVALVVTATVLEIHAVSEDDQRQSAEIKFTALPAGPQRQLLVDEADSHAKSASTTRTEALIIGSVGFVAIAGAVVLWFVEGGSSGSSASASFPAPAKRKLPSILPRLAPGYAGGMLGASF